MLNEEEVKLPKNTTFVDDLFLKRMNGFTGLDMSIVGCGVGAGGLGNEKNESVVKDIVFRVYVCDKRIRTFTFNPFQVVLSNFLHVVACV